MDIDIHWKPVNNMIILMVVNMDFMMTRRTFMGNGVNLWPSNTISYRLSVSYLRGTYGYYWSIIVISILIIIIVQWLIMLNTAVGWFIYIYIHIGHADGYWHSVSLEWPPDPHRTWRAGKSHWFVEESINIFGKPSLIPWLFYGWNMVKYDHPPGDSRGFEDIHDIRGILHIAILHLQTIPHHLKISRDQSDQHSTYVSLG